MLSADDEIKISGDRADAAPIFVASHGFGPFIGFAIVFAAGLLLAAWSTGQIPLLRIAPSHIAAVGLLLLLLAGIYGASIAMSYARIGAGYSRLESEIRRQQLAVTEMREAKDAAEDSNRGKTGFLGIFGYLR